VGRGVGGPRRRHRRRLIAAGQAGRGVAVVTPRRDRAVGLEHDDQLDRVGRASSATSAAAGADPVCQPRTAVAQACAIGIARRDRRHLDR
jgi:hypothetical protein